MYNLDQLTNASQPVTLAGKTYQLRQLKIREWGQLQAWLKTAAPSPIAVAVKGMAELRSQGFAVAPDIETSLFRQAQLEARTWPPRVATQAWFRALDDIEGGHAETVRVALLAAGYDISPDDAADIAEASSGAELTDLMRVCVHGEDLVPKAAGATTPPFPSPTTGASGSSESASPPDGAMTSSAA